MKSFHVLVGASVLCLAVGCGGGNGSPSTGTQSNALTVTGNVSPTTRHLDNARAVAIAATGQTYWAYLDASGNFSLQLPAGHAYRVLVANATSSGALRSIGHLRIHTSSGTSTWLGAHEAGTLALGSLHVAGAATSAGGVTVQDHGGSSGSSGDGADDGSNKSDGGDDDYKCHESDDDGSKVCAGSKDDGEGEDDDTDLDCDKDKDPGDKCDAHDLDDDKEKDDEDSKVAKPCPPAGGGTTPPPPSGGTTPPPPSGGTTPPPASAGGTPPPAGTGVLGSACAVNADCSANFTCVASKCTPRIF